jgi:hypothetical protein
MKFACKILALVFAAWPAYSQEAGAAAGKAGLAADAKAASAPARVGLAASSDPIGGPLIGYAARSDSPDVYPLNGFPGAAFPGPVVSLAQASGRPVVSSVGGYAVAAGEQPGELLIYSLTPGAAPASLPPSALQFSTHPDQIVLSPLGRAAALYERARQQVEIVAGLPFRPVSLGAISLPGAPGVLTALAVSDSGAVALAAFSSARNSGQIYVLRRDAAPLLAGPAGRVVHLAFAPNSHDALAADYDRSQILLLRDGGLDGMQLLAGPGEGVRAPAAVEASTRGEVFVVNDGSPTVLVLSLVQAGLSNVVECGCAASALQRLRNPDAFQLTTGGGPMAVLDADRDLPGVFYIPAGEHTNQQPVAGPLPARTRKR